MRVLVVPKWYPWPDRPVFGSFCREQARALALRHDVAVLASDAVRSPAFPLYELSDQVEDGLRTLRLRYRRPFFRPAAMACQLLGMLVALGRLRRGGWRPDIVHAHVYSAALPALLLGWLSGAPVVVTEHYTGFQRGLITGYDRLTARVAFRRAALVAPVSQDLARYVRALAPRTPVEVIENVVDADVFHPDGASPRRLPGGAPRLLTVAALTAKKGHAHLFEALVALRRTREVHLDLVGDGELRDDLQALVRRRGLEPAVTFHGERSKAEVAELMRESDLFVLPSLYENLPCVLIEAMASGLPFVATAVGGVPELLDGAGGRLCAPGDPEALARAISAALEEHVDPATLAADARRRFGYEEFARRWTAVYARLARPRG